MVRITCRIWRLRHPESVMLGFLSYLLQDQEVGLNGRRVNTQTTFRGHAVYNQGVFQRGIHPTLRQTLCTLCTRVVFGQSCWLL